MLSNYHSIISRLVARLLKKSQLLQNFNRIIFQPAGDKISFNMLCHVPSLNEDIQFGVLRIDKDFMNFLDSRYAPADAWSRQNAYYYFEEQILDISRAIPERVYTEVKNNLNVLLADNPQKINNLIMTGHMNLVIDVVPDLEFRTRNTRRENLINAFKQYKRSLAGQGVAVPHLAPGAKVKSKNITKISGRLK